MRSLSIRHILPLLIITPLITAVGITQWLAVRNETASVNELARRLTIGVSDNLEKRITGYLGRYQVTNEALALSHKANLANLNNFDQLQRYLWKVAQQTQNPPYMFYGTAQGNFLGIEMQTPDGAVLRTRTPATAPIRQTFRLDSQGRRTQRLREQKYDPRDRPWYKAAVAARKAAWSDIFLSTNGEISQAAVVPIYKQNGELEGVTAVQFSLKQISEFLRSLKITPASHIYIIDRTGALIASTVDEPLIHQNSEQRLQAVSSEEPVVRATAQFLLQQAGDFQQVQEQKYFDFKKDGLEEFVYVEPIKDAYGLNWIMVVAMPQADFVGPVYRNSRTTIAIGIAIAGLAALLGVIAARWLTVPLAQLVQSAKAIESNQFDPATLKNVVTRSDEIGQLAQVFQEMASVIFGREKHLQEELRQIRYERDLSQTSNQELQVSKKLEVQQLLHKSRQIRGTTNKHELQLPELLRTVSYFSELTDTQLQDLFAIGYQKVFQKYDVICREQEPGDAFYIILTGSVEVSIEGLKKILRQMVEGEFFGELSLLLGMPRTATVRSLDTTTLFVIDQKGFRIFLQKYPNIAQEIAERMEVYKTELSQRKQVLKESGILENEETFNNNFLQWVQKRMNTVFRLELKNSK